MIDDEAQGAAARRDDEAAAQRARTGRPSRARGRTRERGVGVAAVESGEIREHRRARAREDPFLGAAGRAALARARRRPRDPLVVLAEVERRLARLRSPCDHTSLVGRMTCDCEATD